MANLDIQGGSSSLERSSVQSNGDLAEFKLDRTHLNAITSGDIAPESLSLALSPALSLSISL